MATSNPALPWALTATAGDLDAETRAALADELRELALLHPRWVLLTTCHRVELYGFGPRPKHLRGGGGSPPTGGRDEPGLSPASPPGMRALEGRAAVTRLLRVAAGLESAVVGEDEVLGQVREALAGARARGVDERIARLFETAIATGRAARAEPPPERHGLAERAVAWLSDRAPISGQPVLVVGTGVMGGALRAAASAAGAVVTVAGRRPEVAALDLAGAAGRAHEWSAVAVALRGEWRELAAVPPDGRRLPPLADLSAPPAVPASIRLALGPDFLGIDQLWERAPAGPAWEAAADMAVAKGAGDYVTWVLGRDSVATLIELRERTESRRRARVERLLRRLPDLDERGRRLVEALSVQLVKDVLHEPVSELRADADGGQGEAARRLFRL